jgi:hypothetical protein
LIQAAVIDPIEALVGAPILLARRERRQSLAMADAKAAPAARVATNSL